KRPRRISRQPSRPQPRRTAMAIGRTRRPATRAARSRSPYSTASKRKWRACSAGRPARSDSGPSHSPVSQSLKATDVFADALTVSLPKLRLCALLAGLALASLVTPAAAQDISINFGQGAGLTERVLQLIALLTVLSLAPSILVMVTSFTRIVVVLSLLR